MSDDETPAPGGSGDDGAGAGVKQAKSKPAKKPGSKPAKAKGGKPGKKKPMGKRARAAQEKRAEPSVAGHPRAGRHVRQAKGWGGLVGFAAAAYLSMRAGVPTYEIGIRALAAGAAGYLLAWACSVTVWRHLLDAELRLVAERVAAERAERVGAAEAATAARRE